MKAGYWQVVSGVVVECVLGDIAEQIGFDAVVNAANAELRPGGGVAGALHGAAGPGLEEEGRLLAPLEPGSAVVTGGHRLPNQWVIHCLGPVYGRDRPEEALLASCYRKALLLAEERAMRSVAFPAISTGAFGYPMAEAAKVAVATVVDAVRAHRSVRTVRFVLRDRKALELHVAALRGAPGGVE